MIGDIRAKSPLPTLCIAETTLHQSDAHPGWKHGRHQFRDKGCRHTISTQDRLCSVPAAHSHRAWCESSWRVSLRRWIHFPFVMLGTVERPCGPMAVDIPFPRFVDKRRPNFTRTTAERLAGGERFVMLRTSRFADGMRTVDQLKSDG